MGKQVASINFSGANGLADPMRWFHWYAMNAKPGFDWVSTEDGKSRVWGGNQIALKTPTTGTDIGPILFKTVTTEAPQEASVSVVDAASRCLPAVDIRASRGYFGVRRSRHQELRHRVPAGEADFGQSSICPSGSTRARLT